MSDAFVARWAQEMGEAAGDPSAYKEHSPYSSEV